MNPEFFFKCLTKIVQCDIIGNALSEDNLFSEFSCAK